jgi:hypothetical protein
MALGEHADRFGWTAFKRRRVLEQAEREQARESEAARERLLRHAAAAGAEHRLAA